MDFHEELKSKFADALVDSCRKRGCVLSFESLDRRPTVIDADKYAVLTSHQDKICDYFVFPVHRAFIAVVVEMKAGRVDVSRAVEQLAAGAKVAEAITRGRQIPSFYPLLLSEAIHPMEFKFLSREKVGFRGRKYSVIRERCGVKLSAVVAELVSG